MAMRLTINLATVCMIEYPLIAAELICCAIGLTFKHGVCQYTPHVFLQFACVLSMGTMEEGIPMWWGDEVRRLCRLWHALAERWPRDEHHYLQIMTHDMLLAQWGESMKEDQKNLDKLFPHFVARGDVAYAQHVMAASMDNRFILGDNIADIGAHTEKYVEYVTASDFQPFAAAWLNLRQSILALTTADTESDLLRQAEKLCCQYPQYAAVTFCMDKMMQGTLYFLAEDYEEAFSSFAACAQAKIQLVLGGASKAAVFYLYYGMTAVRLYHHASLLRRAKLYAVILTCRERLFLFCLMSRKYFGCFYDLLEGYRRHLGGAPMRAYMPFYERAIAGAQEQGFTNLEAHAAEALAEAVAVDSPVHLALGPLLVAHRAYQRWGIRYKTKKIADAIVVIQPTFGSAPLPQDNLYTSSSLGGGRSTGQVEAMTTVTGDLSSSQIDTPTLIQAAQALAGEIEIDALKTKLMHLVCANAGARKAHLFRADHHAPLYLDFSLDPASIKTRRAIFPRSICPRIDRRSS